MVGKGSAWGVLITLEMGGKSGKTLEEVEVCIRKKGVREKGGTLKNGRRAGPHIN